MNHSRALALGFLSVAAVLVGHAAPSETSASNSPAEAYSIAQLDSPPTVLQREAPLYPAELRAQKLRGEVVVSLIVDAQGDVRDVSVVRSTHPAFSDCALKSVSRWRFAPGRKDGKNVACRLHVPIVFQLQ